MTAGSEPCGCGQLIRESLARQGIDATVSAYPPIVENPYTLAGTHLCIHGTTWYGEPTGDQIAKWAAEGAP